MLKSKSNLKNLLLAVALIGCLLSSATCDIPQPNSKHRKVDMEGTWIKLLNFVKNGHHDQYKNSENFIKNYTKAPEPIEGQENSLGTCVPGLEPQPFKFGGLIVATINEATPSSAQWENHCYKKNVATFQWIDIRTAHITITSSQKKVTIPANCSDTYVVTDIYNYDVKVIEEEGTHTIEYNFFRDEEIQMVNRYGLKILRLCDSHVNLLPDFFMTSLLFLVDPLLKPNQPEWVRQAVTHYHYDWLHHWQGMALVKRAPKTAVTTEWLKATVKSGDVFCQFAGDGLSAIVMWGTGGACGNTGIFMWGIEEQSGELFVLQSNTNGINETRISDFWAANDGQGIALLQLDETVRSKMDLKKAWGWFETVKGQPYGYANFLFGFLDTPNDNYPQLFDVDSFTTLITMLDNFPIVGKKAIDLVWNRALNKRLGTNGLNWPQIIKEATYRGITLGELIAIPEKEEWTYNGKKQYVCSAFVVGLMYHSGVFGKDLPLVPQEFTPRDLMELKIFQNADERPEQCKDNDPTLPYCQLDGIYEIPATFYNVVEPYPHMNQHCEIYAPSYTRSPKDC